MSKFLIGKDFLLSALNELRAFFCNIYVAISYVAFCLNSIRYGNDYERHLHNDYPEFFIFKKSYFVIISFAVASDDTQEVKSNEIYISLEKQMQLETQNRKFNQCKAEMILQDFI